MNRGQTDRNVVLNSLLYNLYKCWDYSKNKKQTVFASWISHSVQRKGQIVGFYFFLGIYKNNVCFKTGEQKQLCQIFPNRMLTGHWTWIPSLNLALAECVRESFTFFKVFKLENLASVLKTFTDSAQLIKAKYCSIKLSVMQCAHLLDICTVEKKQIPAYRVV